MNIKIDESFEKDLSKVYDKAVLKKVIALYENVASAKSPQEIRSIKKLSGFKTYYRIRVGDYRAGIRIENDTVYFERFLLRKDVYKLFP